jgi:hypothetical protein
MALCVNKERVQTRGDDADIRRRGKSGRRQHTAAALASIMRESEREEERERKGERRRGGERRREEERGGERKRKR